MKPIPNYLSVFDRKLDDLRKKIKVELSKPKKERSKHDLKRLLKSAQKLKKVIKEAKKVTAKRCPHCDGELE